MVTIRQVTSADQTTVTGLCELLLDAVNGGASVGFLAPLSQQTAREYWDNVVRALGGNLYLWVAEVDGRLVGSVQLEASSKQNRSPPGRDPKAPRPFRQSRPRHLDPAHVGSRGFRQIDR